MHLPKSDNERVMKLISGLSTSFKKGSHSLQHLLSEIFGYHSSILWRIDQEGSLSDPLNHYISDYLVEDYLNYFYERDYLHPKKLLHAYRKETVLRLEDVIPMKTYEASNYYTEFMKKHRYYYEMVLLLHSRDTLVGAIGIARSRSENRFTERDLNRIRAIAPFISNLLYLEKEYEKERKEKEVLEAFANKSNTGLLVLDDKLDVLYMNPAVWNIHRETALYKSIDSFIKDIIAMFSNQFTASSKLQLQGYNIQVIAHKEVFLSKESHYAVIIEKAKTEERLENDKIFDKLTEREKEICYYLKKGYTSKEISQKLFISVHTVNKHTRNIYRKAGVNSRALLQARL